MQLVSLHSLPMWTKFRLQGEERGGHLFQPAWFGEPDQLVVVERWPRPVTWLAGSDEDPALIFRCPGCAEMYGDEGIHYLPINSYCVKGEWQWDGNLDAPSISPSIMSTHEGQICHLYLKKGFFEFEGDCTHSLRSQRVPMLSLPDWVIDQYSKKED